MRLGHTVKSAAFILITLGCALLFAPAAAAAPELSTDAEHKGIVAVGPYQIFPENRPGNGVYFKNRLMVTEAERTVIQVVPLAKDRRFIYLTQNVFGNAELGVRLAPSDPKPRMKKLTQGLYFAVMVIQEVIYKKVYRVVQDNTIVDVLPGSKTADGMTPGESGLLFYHVSGAETIEQDGNTVYQFHLRLHLLMYEEERLRSLDYAVINTLPRLKLAWKNNASVEYTLADGRVEVLSTAQFQ